MNRLTRQEFEKLKEELKEVRRSWGSVGTIMGPLTRAQIAELRAEGIEPGRRPVEDIEAEEEFRQEMEPKQAELLKQLNGLIRQFELENNCVAQVSRVFGQRDKPGKKDELFSVHCHTGRYYA
jgi:hypothetical protein